MAFGRETGHSDTIYSLAGLKSRPGTGLVVNQYYLSLAAAFDVLGIPNNPGRVWLLLRNAVADRVYIGLGIMPAIAAGIPLDLDDFLYIDKYSMPWSGPVYFGASANMFVVITEASIET